MAQAVNGSDAARDKFAHLSVVAIALTVLRIGIGWHFLYEGLVKITNPSWTSAGYLLNAEWLFADVFHWMAENPYALPVVDFLNAWGLTLVGAALMLGWFTRTACIGGALLLALYYLASPSLIATGSAAGAEGSYLFIDKNIVEMLALVTLAFTSSGTLLGLDGFIAAWRQRAAQWKWPEPGHPVSSEVASEAPIRRRDLLAHFVTVPVLGGFFYAFGAKRAWLSMEEQRLQEYTGAAGPDGVSGATLKVFRYAKLDELDGTIPKTKLGDLEVSRMILGGNLIGGWAHARDLIYVSDLVKAYHHDEKVFETFRLAEQCGINTFLTNPQLHRVINDYWNKEGGKIQFISDCAIKGDAIEGIKMSIDGGAHSCYVQGGIADRLVAEEKYDEIAEALDLIRENGMAAGIGAHKLETVQGCVEYGLRPDYWMKTLHSTDYWSANFKEEHDNIWCYRPDETIAYMQGLEEPWIAFKILAAGALHPKDAFQYALKNGADFLCVGMYDFQIVEDVNLFLAAYNGGAIERTRPWRA